VAFEGGKSGGLGFFGGGFDFDLAPITATFGREQTGSDAFTVIVVVRKQDVGQTSDWTFSLFAGGDASEQISGPVMLADPDIGEGVFACVSGPFTGPTATAASSCSSAEAYPIPGIRPAELQAVAQGYKILHDMWER
jgi:hypothetical protein